MDLSRREMWTALGASGLLLGLAPFASGDEPDKELSEIEEANIKFVTDFCKDHRRYFRSPNRSTTSPKP